MSPGTSSLPASPATTSEPPNKSEEMTPPSSPPSEGDEVKTEDGSNPAEANDNRNLPGVSETMEEEERRMQELSRKEDQAREEQMKEERRKDLDSGQQGMDSKFKALEFLLSQSKVRAAASPTPELKPAKSGQQGSVSAFRNKLVLTSPHLQIQLYSTIMLSQMQKQEEKDTVKDEKSRKRAFRREETAEKAAQEHQRRSTRTVNITKFGGNDEDVAASQAEQEDSAASTRKGRGRPARTAQKQTQGKMTDFVNKKELEGKAGGKEATVQKALQEEAAATGGDDKVKPTDIGVQNLKSARQPDLVTGGVMRKYQLEGLEWLTSLYENGLNGILADEMGLGKTIQTIAFLGFLREKGTYGPFLIAAPLSTTSNWVDEFQLWTPDIPVVLYHGSKQEREEIRRKRLRDPTNPNFPVVCTSYEICMNDRKHLGHFGWKFVIVDEGHRIKNLNCRLIRELQSYQSANRLLITGTPLQNNLAELWSLLHFLMPEIFDKLESFESWFDFSALKEKNGHEQILSEERKSSLVTSLHAILKPFLLRRVKADVEHSLPKKREYVLFAPLTQEQKELYQEILTGNSRSYLENKVVESISRRESGANTPGSTKSSASKKRKSGTDFTSTPNKSAKTSGASTPATSATTGSGQRGRKAKSSKNYEEISDRAFFRKVDQGAYNAESSSNEASDYDDPKAATLALAKKQIAQKKLQNPIMQLRLCCNSPHNFYDPWLHLADDDVDGATEADYGSLVSASGKMQLLDRLLRALLAARDNHKVLIFSQFKSSLDLLALYLENILDVPPCRIDGSIAAPERADQIRLFNEEDSAHRVFLLSTRAGGQGINLAAADTVILFDSDWNPQQDLQAQDRAHRIGQKRNVVVYRLATRGTVEEMLLGRAEGKRRLEKLVIRKDKFKNWTDEGGKGGKGGRGKKKTGDEDEQEEEAKALAELKRALAEGDGTSVDADAGSAGQRLLSDEDLATLIDRSEEAYEKADRGARSEAKKGGDANAVFKSVETKRDGQSSLLEGLS